MADNPLDLGDMTLVQFKLFSKQNLEGFLHLRGKSISGTFDELVAR